MPYDGSRAPSPTQSGKKHEVPAVSSPTFRTVQRPERHEIDKIKGSRFGASLWPLADEGEVAGHLEWLRSQVPGATHHCWAWRLGRDGDRFRVHDDGEPTGSAGRPILQRIDGHGLTDVLLVVSRTFGGTKLGVGGLIAAYGTAAAEVLERAEVRTITVTRRLSVRHPYDRSGAVRGLLAAMNLKPMEAEFSAEVRFVVDVPEGIVEEFLKELRERTAGGASAD